MTSHKILLELGPSTALLLLSLGSPAGAAAAGSEVPGVANFHQVGPRVYRGAQPTAGGFGNLARLGIQTVIDLREAGERSQAEERAVKAAGMRYVNVPMKGHRTPSAENVEKVLALMESGSAGPVFVHCKRGADRTGMVVACYRIRHDGWGNDHALQEARLNGMSWTQLALHHYVMRYHTVGTPAGTPVLNAVALETAR